MKDTPDFKPGFVIVDVKKGRAALKRYIEKGNKVKITAIIELDTVHSRDDGESIEFSGQIVSSSVWRDEI